MVWIFGWKQGLFFWKILGCGSDWHFFIEGESSWTMINQWIFGLHIDCRGWHRQRLRAKRPETGRTGRSGATRKGRSVMDFTNKKRQNWGKSQRISGGLGIAVIGQSVVPRDILSPGEFPTRWFVGMRFFRPSTGYCGTRVNPSHLTFASRSWRLSFLNSFNVFPRFSSDFLPWSNPMIWRQASFGVRWSRHLLLPRCQRSLPA